MAQQLAPDELGICGRNGLVNFTLIHPVDAHGFAGGGERAISSARDLYEILPFVGLPKMSFTLIEGMDFRML